MQKIKTIAEYAIQKWMEDNYFALECFDLSMSGNEGTIRDRQGASMVMVYDPRSKTVKEKAS